MAGAFERIEALTQKLVDAINPTIQVIGKISETVSRFVDSYNFSGSFKILEGLSTALTLLDNDATTEEAEPSDNIEEDTTNTHS